MKDIAIAAVSMALLIVSAASAGSPSLAAPGDCAQPIRDLDTGPLPRPPSGNSGGVAGPPADLFAPVRQLKS